MYRPYTVNQNVASKFPFIVSDAINNYKKKEKKKKKKEELRDGPHLVEDERSDQLKQCQDVCKEEVMISQLELLGRQVNSTV